MCNCVSVPFPVGQSGLGTRAAFLDQPAPFTVVDRQDATVQPSRVYGRPSLPHFCSLLAFARLFTFAILAEARDRSSDCGGAKSTPAWELPVESSLWSYRGCEVLQRRLRTRGLARPSASTGFSSIQRGSRAWFREELACRIPLPSRITSARATSPCRTVLRQGPWPTGRNGTRRSKSVCSTGASPTPILRFSSESWPFWVSKAPRP